MSLTGWDADGARPLAAWAYENAGMAGLAVEDMLQCAQLTPFLARTSSSLLE